MVWVVPVAWVKMPVPLSPTYSLPKNESLPIESVPPLRL